MATRSDHRRTADQRRTSDLGRAAATRLASQLASTASISRSSFTRLKAAVFILPYLLDVAMLVLAFVLGYWARGTLPLFAIPPAQPPLSLYLPTMALHIAVIITLMFLQRMYHQPRSISRIDQARTIVGAVTIGSLLVMGIQDLFFRGADGLFEPIDYPRSLFFYVVVFSTVCMVIGRELYSWLRRSLRARGIEQDSLLIIGMNKVARDIIRKIHGSPELGYHIVGIVSLRPTHHEAVLGIPVVGGYDAIPQMIDQHNVNQVIIALPDSQRTELSDIVTLCQRGRVDIKVYPDMFAYVAREMSFDELGDIPLVTVRDIALRGWKLSLKRALDITGALVGLVFLSPFLLFTGLLIKLDSPGPVFYTQERMGLDGKPFQMIKFRSMRIDSETTGPGWTRPDDERVTRLGRLMRATSWDELPQLINVLLGEMSLVGPRPERPVYVQQFRERIPRYMERHREKAGMTGWAQVNGLRGDTSISERTSYDLWYVENWSLWLDIKIIIRTVLQVVLRRARNAY
jgi:exopolysaccharide biosynthesis polyprenyl glycosylphosphotransferase